MTGTAAVVAEMPRAPAARPGIDVSVARRWPSGSLLVFGLAATAYLVIGVVLVAHHDLPVDALARVASSAAAVGGRDPHLAAIGFVWSPLPTVTLLPLAFLGQWFPELLSHGYIATVASSAAMAGAVTVAYRTLADLGLGRAPRAVATAALAAHPAIVLYGGNGMSEALALLALMVACRHLTRWLLDPHPGALVGCGLALAAGYLCRYEVVAAAGAVSVVVGAVGFSRHERDDTQSWATTLTDIGLVAAPSVLAFVVWAGASWAIVGSPFEQFTSEYGNAAQVEAAGIEMAGLASLHRMARQVVGLQPMVGGILVVALLAARRLRQPAVLAPVATFGAVVAASMLLESAGATFPWLRFKLAVVPLAVLVAGALVATVPHRIGRGDRQATAFVAMALLPALVTAGAMLLDRELAIEEAPGVIALVAPHRSTPEDQAAISHDFERFVASEIDELALDDGEILIDLAFGHAVTLASDDPHQFVKTTDRDFQAAVREPAAHGVRYLLVPPRQGHAANEAVNRIHPRLREGVGPARHVRSFDGPGARDWDLFEVVQQPAG